MENQCVEISYKLADGKRIRVEVSIEVVKQLSDSDRQIRSQRRQERRRHTEYIDGVTDTASVLPHEDFADLVYRIDLYKWLYIAIEKLSDIQRRRLLIRYLYALTYREIANMEGVDHKTVAESVTKAVSNLRKLLVK